MIANGTSIFGNCHVRRDRSSAEDVYSYPLHRLPVPVERLRQTTANIKFSVQHVCNASKQEVSDTDSEASTACYNSDCYNMADDIAAGESFRQAFYNSAPPIIPDDLAGIQLAGIQQFAAAIWDRQKHIPAQGPKPPLERIFDAFDADGDGELTPSEIAAALRSRGVDITEEVARKFVQASDEDNNETVEKAHFGTLVLLMASADLRVKMISENNYEYIPECDGDDCEIEWDDNGEIRLPTAPHCQSDATTPF